MARRFAHQAASTIAHFAESWPGPFVEGVLAARGRIVAPTDRDRVDSLRKLRFGKAGTASNIATVLGEETYPPTSAFNFVQGIIANARLA